MTDDVALATVDRFGMIDEAGGHEPLYWGRTNDVAQYGISGEEYVRYTDYTALLSRLEAETARADRAEAAVAEYQRREQLNPLAGLSTTGINIWGDDASIKAVSKALHYSAQLDAFKEAFDQRKAQLKAESARLAAELAEARKIVEPFAKYIDKMKFDIDYHGNPLPDDQAVGWIYVTNGDFRAARAWRERNG